MMSSLEIQVAIAVLLLPLAAFAVQLFFGRKLARGGDWVSILAILGSFSGAFYLARQALAIRDPLWSVRAVFDWFTVGSTTVQGGILIDNVTAVMLVVVTGVSSLVHIYSTSYMHGDPKYSRYFGFLSLFSFSMLGLILSDNLFFLYCFWELVGLSSYFLIGFWSEKQAPADASKKAFLTNRVGDIGFFLGIMILWLQLGVFGYEEVFQGVATGKVVGGVSCLGIFDISWLTLAGLLLFCGAIGKSAQFPLHVWLPDAMEGPTPVSALIHAATMVAAGVYMVGRLYPIFTPSALIVIAYVGCITAFFAGTIAITATDIKRVLAYSTVSQLGYMVMGLGVGGYVAGLFHLMTHAWFKALLFLCSGSVIHGVHSQEMPEMGGLKRKMPYTYVTMLIGTLALCGVPPLSGFFSKDAILAACLSFGMDHPQHLMLFVLGVIGAGITTFYMFRLIFLTFFGEPRDRHKHDHAHESPAAMVLPLVYLAILSITAGWGSWFDDMVQPPSLARYRTAAAVHELVESPWSGPQKGWGDIGPRAARHHGVAAHGADSHHENHTAHTMAMICSLLAVVFGFSFAVMLYYTRSMSADAIAAANPVLYDLLKNKYYVDEFYTAWIVRPLLRFQEMLASFDLRVIDGVVNGCARVTVVVANIMGRIDVLIVDAALDGMAQMVLDAGQRVRRLQMGRVQDYLVISFAVTVIFVLTLSLLS